MKRFVEGEDRSQASEAGRVSGCDHSGRASEPEASDRMTHMRSNRERER